VEAIEPQLGHGDELIVVSEPPRSGPSAARNRGAGQAKTDVLVFVDSDVVVHADALERVRSAFAEDPSLTAMFGSYDDGPRSRGLVSEFRNLLHHHVHHQHPGSADTFWAGLGAVRRAEFLLLEGFDTTRFTRPSVEDIDLGMRLRDLGGRIELRPSVQGTHLKRWTLKSMVVTDFHRRGVPWTLMCLERQSWPGTLNLSWHERTSAVAMLAGLSGIALRRRGCARASAAAIVALNSGFYKLLIQRMGLLRGTLAIGLHALHRLIGAAALPSGALVYAYRQTRTPSASRVSNG
jgi:hypothetical protein